MESASISANQTQLGADWTDPKRYLWTLGLIVPLAPFIAWALFEISGSTIAWFVGPFLVFAVIPFLDTVIGKDSANPPDSVLKRLEADRYYQAVLYLFLPLQLGSLVFAASLWGGTELALLDKLGLALTVAMVAGIGINTAHELGHKRKLHEKWLAKVALAQTFYGHFFIEHNRGHHVRVSTPEDPASSRLGESFWAFLPRTVKGSLVSAIELERERLDRLDKSFWTPRNDVLNAWAMSVVLFGGLILAFGVEIAPWLIIQAVVGFSLLEVVNYLEHYGLLRQKREDGRYERCAPEHSWNSDNIASNVFLYHLQRHSDHHANPVRRYQALRHFEGLPELPSGYATMIVLAWFPPIWRRIMDPRVLAHYDGDVTKANILPRKRKKILARYGDKASLAAADIGTTDALSGFDSSGADSAATASLSPTLAYKRAQSAAADSQPSRPIPEGDAFRCPGCSYTYTVAAGAPREGFPAGTAWSDVPDDWCCPDCGVREKVDFEPLRSVAAS